MNTYPINGAPLGSGDSTPLVLSEFDCVLELVGVVGASGVVAVGAAVCYLSLSASVSPSVAVAGAVSGQLELTSSVSPRVLRQVRGEISGRLAEDGAVSLSARIPAVVDGDLSLSSSVAGSVLRLVRGTITAQLELVGRIDGIDLYSGASTGERSVAMATDERVAFMTR